MNHVGARLVDYVICGDRLKQIIIHGITGVSVGLTVERECSFLMTLMRLRSEFGSSVKRGRGPSDS